MRITGGIPVGGNLGYVAGGLSFPIDTDDFNQNDEKEFKQRFQAPGSWREQIKEYQRQNPLQRQMPSAGIGNVGGLLAQAPSNTQQDVGGFEKLLEGMEEQQRMRMRGANQFMTAPNQFIPYPIQQY